MGSERKEAVSAEEAAGERPSALGKYEHLPLSSADFMERKQEEIDWEDRNRSPESLKGQIGQPHI